MKYIKMYFCARVSLIRPAPAESPQDRNVARVSGCSGAIWRLALFLCLKIGLQTKVYSSGGKVIRHSPCSTFHILNPNMRNGIVDV